VLTAPSVVTIQLLTMKRQARPRRSGSVEKLIADTPGDGMSPFIVEDVRILHDSRGCYLPEVRCLFLWVCI